MLRNSEQLGNQLGWNLGWLSSESYFSHYFHNILQKAFNAVKQLKHHPLYHILDNLAYREH